VSGTIAASAGSSPMRIREEDRNMVLLATVTAFTAAIAGVIALAEPAPEPAPTTSASDPYRPHVVRRRRRYPVEGLKFAAHDRARHDGPFCTIPVFG